MFSCKSYTLQSALQGWGYPLFIYLLIKLILLEPRGGTPMNLKMRQTQIMTPNSNLVPRGCLLKKWLGLFPPDPFFKGKALWTRLTLFKGKTTNLTVTHL